MSEGRLTVADDSPSNVARQAIPRGARLYWADRGGSRSMGKTSFGLMLFGLCFLGIATTWTVLVFLATREEGGFWFLLPFFGLPFVLAGLRMVLSPIWNRFSGVATVYALTDRHVFVIVGRKRRMVWMVDISSVGPITVTEQEGGIGNIIFAAALPGLSDGRKLSITGIYGIPRVTWVAGRLERLRDDAVQAERAALVAS